MLFEHYSLEFAAAQQIPKDTCLTISRPPILVLVAGDLPCGQVMKKVLMAEGVGGLYRGMLAMSYKTILWCLG